MQCNTIQIKSNQNTTGFLFYGIIFLAMKMSNNNSGFLNPAFTLALFIINISRADATTVWWHILRLFAYWFMQFAAALLGVLTIFGIVPGVSTLGQERGGISIPSLNETPVAAFLMTIMLSLFLTFLILSVKQNEDRSSSLIICFGMIATRLVSFPLVNGYLNPARTLAHAINAGGANGAYANSWIDIGGSFIGSGVAAGLFLLWMRKKRV
jgi:glycerol uptake facilitator-like aquaporin